MNLEESNKFVEQMEKNNKNKRIIIATIVVLAVIIILLIITINYIRAKDAKKLKMYVNGRQINITSTLLLQDDEGNNYMNVKELANLLGYSYQKGEYKNYTEDPNSCYLETPYEIISMSSDSNIITKYIVNKNALSENETISNELIVQDEETKEKRLNIIVDSEDETVETFNINDKILFTNNELYIPFTELPRIFSAQLNTSTYRIGVNTIPNIATSISQIAANLGYSGVSNLYENLTAIIDNMLVVNDGVSYGVISLQDGHEIISLKYDKILYRQDTEEFFVTAENSVGIIDKNGKTIIKPTAYESISSFDEITKLYLVKKDNKYGILNREGQTVIYAEYDEIGLKNAEDFENEDIRNYNLLFEKCIPVNNNGKVGLFDIDGNERLKCVYDSLGFTKNDIRKKDDKSDSSNTNSNSNSSTNETNTINTTTTEIMDYDNVLIIPEDVGIQGIVVNLNGLYGIYDAEVGKLIIPCVYTKIYSKTRAGKTIYYLEYNDQEIVLSEYLAQNNLLNIKDDNNKSINENVENNIENIEE